MEDGNNKRKPNWSESEVLVLTTAVADNIKIIKGAFSPSLTIKDKHRAWADVAERVNAVNTSGIMRTLQNIKKKWFDISGQMKSKEVKRRQEQTKTGGGTPPVNDLKPWEEMILRTFTPSQIEGIPGGTDTMEIKDSSQFNSLPVPYCETDQESDSSLIEVSLSASTILNDQSKVQDTVSTNTWKRKNVSEGDAFQAKILKLEEEKAIYRKRKLEILEGQLEEQRKIRLALERMSADQGSNYCLSPVIKLSEL